jgi:hypothetical protein
MLRNYSSKSSDADKGALTAATSLGSGTSAVSSHREFHDDFLAIILLSSPSLEFL